MVRILIGKVTARRMIPEVEWYFVRRGNRSLHQNALLYVVD